MSNKVSTQKKTLTAQKQTAYSLLGTKYTVSEEGRRFIFIAAAECLILFKWFMAGIIFVIFCIGMRSLGLF